MPKHLPIEIIFSLLEMPKHPPIEIPCLCGHEFECLLWLLNSRRGYWGLIGPIMEQRQRISNSSFISEYFPNDLLRRFGWERFPGTEWFRSGHHYGVRLPIFSIVWTDGSSISHDFQKIKMTITARKLKNGSTFVRYEIQDLSLENSIVERVISSYQDRKDRYSEQQGKARGNSLRGARNKHRESRGKRIRVKTQHARS